MSISIILIMTIVMVVASSLSQAPLQRQINRWPNRPHTNQWLTLARYAVRILLLLAALSLLRFLFGITA